MRKYSIFHIPTLSFFSKDLYVDVARNFEGLNFLYLLLLLAGCLIPMMVQIHQGISDFIDNEAPVYVNQVPQITITDGLASIEEAQPYYIRNPDTNEPVAIIDTTGQITSIEEPNALCLLTANKVITKNGKHETRIYDLAEIKNFVVDSKRITGWLQIARNFLAIILYPFILLSLYVYRIIQVLIYAAVGLLFALICKTKLSYAALIRLSVAAVTPCIIAGTIFNVFKVSIPPFLYLATALVYLFFAVKAVAGIPKIDAQADMNPPETD